jgi:hypothetical protein
MVETESTLEVERQAESNVADIPDDRDWFLANLVRLVNEADLQFPLSLQAGGVTICGRLIGGSEYFRRFADQFVAGWQDDETKIAAAEHLAGLGDVYGAPQEGQPFSYPHFIHLADARVFAPGSSPMPGNEGVLWRGRLSEISGFWMGQLSVRQG